jgi:methionyl-tRNA formyltransferase
MRLAIIISSPLGFPLLHALTRLGVVAGVAVPATSQADTDELAVQVQGLGLAPRRLVRASLGYTLADWLTELQPNAVLVLTFPWRIPAHVLVLPPHGFLNVHFAALPGYRGPAPLFWQLRNREPAGAVTIHRMEADFDTGAVLLTLPVPIGPDDTYGLHHTNLATMAATLAPQLVVLLQLPAGALPLQPQPRATARYWPRPTLPDLCLRWAAPAAECYALVRAANPWNRGVFILLRGHPIRILAVQPLPGVAHEQAPGTVLRADAQAGVVVACGNGEVLRIEMVLLAEGYFTGLQLIALGLQTGERLETLPLPATVGSPEAAMLA